MKQSFFAVEHHMPKALSALVAILIATAIVAASAVAADPPKIQVSQPVYDFGSALSGPAIHHTFKVKNVGGSELVIDHVQTSCGCTAAEPSKKHLQPGEDADIAVTFDTRLIKGHSERTITVFSNDPHTPESTMTIKGQLTVEFETTPKEVFFGKARLGTEESRQVTVTYTGKGDFKVSKISNSSPSIKVAQAPLKDGKSGVILTVTRLKTMPVGPFDDSIEIDTSRQPILVHVSGRIVGDIAVEPPQVSFGIVPHGQGAVRVLRVANSGSHPVQVTEVSPQITSAATPPHSVVAKVEPVTPGKEYKVTLELRQGTPDGQLRGKLSIKTDDPQEPVLTVPFFGIVGAFEG
ncbi:MAG: DUF1573 domain-containing protein [Candidatus Binataceae bacterium]|jgi:hypothetical protein